MHIPLHISPELARLRRDELIRQAAQFRTRHRVPPAQRG